MRWALILVTLISPALADEPDGPDDARTAPPVQEQPPPPPLPPPPPMLAPPIPPQQFAAQQHEEAQRLLRSGKSMRAAGAFMIALGAALELTGLVFTFYSQLADGPTCVVKLPSGTEVCGEDPRTPFVISGVVMDLAGGGLLGGGLAVFAAGNNRIRRGKLMKLHMSFGQQEVRAQVGFTF